MFKKLQKQNPQKGVAAIFIVIFFALLIGVITLSFVRITIQDQQASTNNDLSQSAFDSATAGVEDARRAIRKFQELNFCQTGAGSQPCDTFLQALGSAAGECNLGKLAGSNGLPGLKPSGQETRISSNSGDDALDQAYTCVTIKLQTPDYVYGSVNNKSTLVPLKTANNQAFSNVELNWYQPKQGVTPTFSNSFPELPKSTTEWKESSPPLMRVEIIPIARGSIDIDDTNGSTKTVFLYPVNSGGSNTVSFNTDPGRNSEKSALQPQRVKCDSSFPPYTCHINLADLPSLASAPGGIDYYLRITPIYNNADFQVRLNNGPATPYIYFDNVEPEVDSTGRANNVFRRVKQRVVYGLQKSDGGFDISQGLCKYFNVASLESDWSNLCNPSSLNEE